MNALKYFKQLMQWQEIRANLESNISNLVTSLVVKNIAITSNLFLIIDSFPIEAENDIFYEEPQTFIETFIEYSDLDTRRA